MNLEISYHPKQNEIFFGSKKRFNVIAKGRRFGLTRGFANYVIENMLEDVSPILWVDTIFGNIERYVERYFMPTLKQLPQTMWNYNMNRNLLEVKQSVCDFRSADRPENIEGFGYRLIIVNEAGIVLKNRNLWTETILPMILDYKAEVFVGGTPKGIRNRRSGEQHLFYELYRKEEEGKENWRSYNFSSYDNPLLDKEEIDELASELPTQLREQELFGKFVERETSGIIKREWFVQKEFDEDEKYLSVIQSWDTAYKTKEGNDYSVCTTWGVKDDGFYLIDVWKKRLEFPELKKRCVMLDEIYNPNEILIEDKASGQSLAQELKRETFLPIKEIKVDRDKEARVNAITPLIEKGKVFIKKGAEWVDDFLRECEDFPDGEFDDSVDSMSQFLNYAKLKSRRSYYKMRHIKRDSLKRYKNYLE